MAIGGLAGTTRILTTLVSRGNRLRLRSNAFFVVSAFTMT